jgi:hypothetical protein
VSVCAIVSFIAIGFGIVGIFRDGIAYGYVKTFATCVHGPTSLDIVNGTSSYSVKIYGQNSRVAEATSCYLSQLTQGYDCNCVQSSGSTCFYYNGQSDCNNILTVYPTLLKFQTALDLAATGSVFLFFALACVSLCCAPTSAPAVSDEEDGDKLAEADSGEPIKTCAHVVPFIYCPVCQAKLEAEAAAEKEAAEAAADGDVETGNATATETETPTDGANSKAESAEGKEEPEKEVPKKDEPKNDPPAVEPKKK